MLKNLLKSINSLKIDECYLDLVPRPTRQEFTCLQSSIILEGQKDPIVINKKGVVLDGHTRYEIMRDIGKKEIEVRIKDFKDIEEEELYVMSSNTNRRQLNAFQKSEIFYSKYLEFKRQAKWNASHSNYGESKYPIGGSSERYGLFLGICDKTMYQTLKIIHYGNEEMNKKLRNGSITINQAYNIIMKNEKPKRIKNNKQKRNYPSVNNLLVFLEDKDKETLLRFIKEYNMDKQRYG